MDSTPLVLVTGQVGSALLGTDAFQETNFIGITQAVTKWNCQVKRTEDIPAAIAKAFYIARSGRPGPVVVDITKDAQCGTAPFRYEKITSIRSYLPAPAPDAERIAEAARLIDQARRPLVMVGQGVILGNAEAELRALSRQERHARRLDPAGSLGPADRPSAKRRHAGHARQLRSQHQEPGVRPARRRGHAFRRPRDGRIPRISAPTPRSSTWRSTPRRSARSSRPTWRSSATCKRSLPLHHRAHPPTRPQRNGSPDSAPATRSNTKPSSARPCIPPRGVSAWARRSPPWPGPTDNDAVLVTDVGQQQMFAARYFGFRRTPQRGHLGRSRHDGIRTSGGHRGQAGRPRPRSRPFRGRRRPANDHSGAGHDLPVARSP